MIFVQRHAKEYIKLKGKNFDKLGVAKYNEINVSHLDVQKYRFCKNTVNNFNFSHTRSHKTL